MSETSEKKAKHDEAPAGSKGNDLGRKLEEVGLEAEKWLLHFRDTLGVEKAQLLQFLGAEDYLKLEKHTDHSWEKQALKKLLNIEGPQASLKELLSVQETKRKDNQAKAKAGLEETKKLTKEAKTNIDKMANQPTKTMEKAREKSETLEKTMEKSHKELTVKDGEYSNSGNISAEGIFYQASGGLALEGIYMTKQLEDVLMKRERLLAVPEGIILTGPMQSPVFQQKEFSSSEAESTFYQSVEKLGFSIATSAKGGFWGFQAEASLSYATSSVSEQRKESHTEQTYISTTKYNYIPLKSCFINHEQLHLSSAALEELRTTEKLLTHSDKIEKPSIAKQRYEKFFSRFGSHANQGPLHFGGIYWWTASSQGFKQELLEEMREETRRAVDTSVGASYSGSFSAAASVETSKTESRETSSKEERNKMKKCSNVRVQKTGGPASVDSLDKWKTGLQDNTTWSVIDRGVHLIPVWDIILSHHVEDFKNVYEVAKDLKNVYGSVTGLHHRLSIGENVSTAVFEANSFLSHLNSWPVEPAHRQLQRLIDFRQYLNEKTGNYNLWLNVCLPHEDLRCFLEKVVKLYSEDSRADESVIRCMLKCLLQHIACSSENIDLYATITKWIYQSKKEENFLSITDFSALTDLISQAKNDLLQMSPADDINADEEEVRAKVTVVISSYLQSFLKTLNHMEQKEEELLILCVASCVGYSLQNNYFRYCLGWQEVNFLLEKMKYLFNEYKALKGCKAQAFILVSGVTLGDEERPRTAEQKREFLSFAEEKMKRTLESEIQNILNKHSEDRDLHFLITELNHLYLGNYDAINTENLVNEIKSVCEGGMEDAESTTVPQTQLITANKEANNSYTQDIHSLMQSLGLEQYFPRGLNRRHFCVVHKSFQNPPEKESELPSQFMQMLMRLDYRFRYLTCKNSNLTDNTANVQDTKDEINVLDTVDDLFEFCTEEEPEALQTEIKGIHPVDLMLAIYHCADDLMKQYIFTKLSMCQFALPLVVPRPYDSRIEIPLWAFRQVQKSILESAKHKEKPIYQIDFPVVCFTRFGASSFSKSQILNNLLSKHRHDIFFHRNCESSVKNRVLFDGLAEIFWFCPSGKDTDQFENCTAFVNLRGDAGKHNKQAAFLQEISTINVVLFSKSDQKESGNEMSSKELKQKPLIILSPDREASVNVNTESKRVIIGLKNQNEAKVLEELNKTLRRLLASSPQLTGLELCAEIGRRHGFLVDEDDKECSEGKMHAQKIMSILEQKDLLTAKEELLPLSGELWHLWCKKDKELTQLQNKMNRSIEQHCAEIETSKKSIRTKQLEKASHNEFIKAIISQLKSLSTTTKLFFLQWLKINVDTLSCDRVMDLRDEYNSLWGSLNSEQMKDKDLMNTIQQDLESFSDQMNACMFGLEHIQREVGQTYEALCDLQYKDDCFHALPKIAADMMVSGYPIELMDGDACYVPLKWIKAVLGELNKKIGDKNIFVLSVLGVQSSGKSTLLNTMFGLQFAVSAGRCTRGAFMQLVEIADDLKKDLDFDFILVIDTEGLRAMELSNKTTLNHDNELATFVIGVGNMTLINVFGENPAEIKDILQIAVQAFLRMKQVKLSSSCLFVHQNVGDLTANDKNMEGRRNLQMELDNMTALAAEQEQCNVQHFSEVIRFDAKNHIHYFAHLWEGNPPMAPPNPHYSENAQKVKDIILRCMANDRYNVLNLSKLTVRIEDLWSALRNENFVFSFKNTLEISAYSKVENKYKQLTWQLRRSFLELQTKLNNKIKKGEISLVRQNAMEEEVKEKFDAIKEEFETFFNEEKDREILVQWKANVENRVNSLHTELVEETKRQATELIGLKKSQGEVEKRQMDYEEELFTKSKQLALDLKKEGLDESQLRNHFNILWQEWVTEINATIPRTKHPNIKADAEDVVLQYFKHERSMNDKLNQFSTWMSFTFDLSKHVVKKRNWNVFKSHPDEADEKRIMQEFHNMVKAVQEYLEKKLKERVDYNETFFYEIIDLVSETISNISSTGILKKCTLTKLFNYEVTLYLFGFAVPIFDSMHKNFEKANNPIVTLEGKRGEFFSCFTISCQGAASIKTFSDFLCLKVLEAIRPSLYDRTALAIVDEMTSNYPAFSGNRSKLENHILIDLAQREDFEQYREYIHFPQRFFKSFIEKCVHEYCLGKNSPRLKHFLQISFDYFHKQVLLSISESTRFVKNRNGNVSDWLDDFYERIEDLVTFSRADLKSIEHQEMQDIEFIQEAMCRTWDSAASNFLKNFETTSFEDFDRKPHEILIKQLCGCWEQCPFCRAICTNTIPCHDGDHSVPFHRSQAINGMPWLESNEFVTEICSTLVSSDDCLVIDNKTQFLYKHYRKIGPNYANWSITQDTSAQSYWKWYVCHFRQSLEEDYGLKFEGRGEIPAQWETISKEEVIATLREQL